MKNNDQCIKHVFFFFFLVKSAWYRHPSVSAFTQVKIHEDRSETKILLV